MRSVFVKQVINRLFLFALFIPAIAVFQSPQLKQVVVATLQSPEKWNEQREILRRTTILWDKAVGCYSKILYQLGSSNSKSVAVVGRDGWVFLGDIFNSNISQALGRRYYNATDIASWGLVLNEQKEWLARRNIQLLFVVAPAKWSIYPDKLPEWTQGHIGKHSFDQLLESSRQLPIIDLRDFLIEVRSKAETYSKFNSHWNSYGAWVAWSQIAKKLAEKNPEFTNLFVPKIRAIEIRDYGNEYASMINLVEPNPWATPVFEKALPNFEMVDKQGQGVSVPGTTETGLLDLPKKTRNLSVGNHLRALILRDSMGDSISPYFQMAFEETYQLRHYMDQPEMAPNVPAQIEEYKPNVVIYIMTERFFNNIPQSGPFWYAANLFDLAKIQVAEWYYSGGVNKNINLQGDSSLITPATFAWNQGAHLPNVLKLDMDASAPGLLIIKVSSKNIETAFEQPYAQGKNILFLKLPDAIDKNQITLIRKVSNDSKLQLKRVTLRAL